MTSATTRTHAAQRRYAQLAANLRQRIERAEWTPGQALPSEAALAHSYGVALGTMRQALALLVQAGVLERRQGKGTYVREGLSGASMLRFFRFAGTDRARLVPTSAILAREVRGASAHELDRFGLDLGAQVLQLLRLRSIDNRPCLLETIALPLPQFAALAEWPLADWEPLLYPMYQRCSEVTILHATDHIQFDVLQAEQAQLLALGRHHPCVRVQREAFDLQGRCVELRTTLGDAYAFEYTAQIR